MKIVIAQQKNNLVWILLLIGNDGFEVFYRYLSGYTFKAIWISVISKENDFVKSFAGYCFLPEVTSVNIRYNQNSFFHFFVF